MVIRKLFKAEMAHAVPFAYSKRCRHLHGHSYKFELFLKGHFPNPAHMVTDFKAVKDTGIADFFDSFDHAVMLWEKDPRASLLKKINPERFIRVPFIPTAEMMAKAFFHVSRAILETGPRLSGEKGARVDSVIVHETDTGSARFGETDLVGDSFPDVRFDRWIISPGIRADWKVKTWVPKVAAYFKEAANGKRT